MDEYDFKANWSEMSVFPPNSGERCLVTDGDVVVIATYLIDNKSSIWIFSELNEAKTKPFDVKAWMRLPRPLAKIIPLSIPNSSSVELPPSIPVS